MNANELTADQKAKVDSCKTPDDVIALAKDEGYSLSDDELESINGGKDWWRCEDYHATSGPY